MLKYYEVFTSFRIATSFFLMKFLTFLNQILSQFSYAFPTAAKCSFKIYLLRPAFEIEKGIRNANRICIERGKM